jgi:hypothetical protein
MCGCTTIIAQEIPINNQTCLYTFDQLTAALVYTKDPFNNAIVRSAISWYSKDCNKFNNKLNGIIQ